MRKHLGMPYSSKFQVLYIQEYSQPKSQGAQILKPSYHPGPPADPHLPSHQLCYHSVTVWPS